MAAQLSDDRRGATMQSIRKSELESVKELFAGNPRVLEIGGGLGYQASQLAQWGCEVTSVDLAGREVRQALFFPVETYDGTVLPYPDDTFDIVFSSNVLEHVPDLRQMVSETHRVLRGGGLCIHIMPTPAWRFWTSVTHYVSLIQFGWLRARGRRPEAIGCFEGPRPGDVIAAKGLGATIRRAALPGPHGEYPSASAELLEYSRSRWTRRLRACGSMTTDVRRCGVFYAGYGLFPKLTVRQRQRLAAVFGSSCQAYLCRPCGNVDR